MELVAAAFGSDLDLRTAEAAVLGVVAVRDDLHVAHRVFTGRDDRGATPDRTYRADAVDGNAVGLILAAAILDLGTVFGFENSACAARCSKRRRI